VSEPGGPPGSRDEERPSEALRRVDELVARLPRVEPSPQFEARFWARLARQRESDAEPRGLSERLWRLRPTGWLVGAGAAAALALLLTLGDPALPEQDWNIVADGEGFDLLQEGDLELLSALDVLEAWNGSQDS
jgi:hypothetical protein